MSDFATWFEKKYGKREWIDGADVDLRAHVVAGERAKAEIVRRQRWDDQRDAALKAWWEMDKMHTKGLE